MVFVALRRRSRGSPGWLRLLACGMVATLVLQGSAALLTLVHGPAHRHLSTLALEVVAGHGHEHDVGQVGVAAAATERHAHELAHARAHAEGRAHHHAHHAHGDDHEHGAFDVPIPEGADAALEAAAWVLLAALIPLGAAGLHWTSRRQRAGWPVCGVRAQAQRTVSPPRRPPRG